MSENYGPLSSLLHVVLLQMLTYQEAYRRGQNAKSGEERDGEVGREARPAVILCN